MAQSYTTPEGVTLKIPGAYPSVQVAASNTGLSTTGVLMLVGEADAGPDHTLESDLEATCSFGPDQEAEVVAKYVSGPLVDAFRAATAPSATDEVQGAFSRCILVKTNVSGKAKSTLAKFDASSYGVLADKSYSKLGNLIYFAISASASEVVPTTGEFTMLVPVGGVNLSVRADGGTVQAVTVNSGTKPPAVKTALNALTDIAATGGTDRDVLDGLNAATKTIAITALGSNVVQIDISATDWPNAPVVGDTLYIGSTSAIKGGSSQNAGSYVVTSVGTATLNATKLRNASGSGDDAVTAPVTVAAQSIGASEVDIEVYAPIVVTHDSSNPKDGIGKSIEIAELTTGADLLSRYVYAKSTTAVTWISKAAGAKLITSASEYSAKININRQFDRVQEEFVAGGEIPFQIAYTNGTTGTATLTITKTALTTSCSDSADNLSLTLSDYPTLADLVSVINSKTHYQCKVTTARDGNLPVTALDRVSAATIASTFGAYAGRIKIDAYRFFNKVSESAVVQLGETTVERANLGLPKPQPASDYTYLAGGSKGSTSDAQVQAAIDALEDVDGNFLVPLFSRDASEDILDSETESSSSYTIDTINAYARTHCSKLSTLKRRKNRQAIVSKRDTFNDCRDAASNTNFFRCNMTFMDVKNTSTSGIKQFKPWMGAVMAAAMQAAAFYKPIFNKALNIQGALQAEGDYKPNRDSDQENALDAGLMPMKFVKGTGWIFVSDQTTYGKDNNFVFNSLQATYVADIVALTCAQRMEKAFVGKSVADVDAALAVVALESIMEDLMRLKLIAKSDDAPRGYKNVLIKISGPAMVVRVEIKLAGAIYFVPINFLVTQVTQTAAA